MPDTTAQRLDAQIQALEARLTAIEGLLRALHGEDVLGRRRPVPPPAEVERTLRPIATLQF